MDSTWRKSSYSGPNGGECVEVAATGAVPHIAMVGPDRRSHARAASANAMNRIEKSWAWLIPNAKMGSSRNADSARRAAP